MAVGAGIETGVHLIERVAHAGEGRPSVLLYRHLECLGQDRHGVKFLFFAFGFLCFIVAYGSLLRDLLFSHKVFGVNKYIAGVHEWFWRFLFANSHHKDARLADAGGKPRVIAVARNEAEAIHHAGVQDVHRVDDHGAVCRILANGVTELLDWLEGVEIKCVLPRVHAVGRPVPVNTADSHLAVTTGLHKHLGKQTRLGIVAVDQHRNLVARKGFNLFVCHEAIIHFLGGCS